MQCPSKNLTDKQLDLYSARFLDAHTFIADMHVKIVDTILKLIYRGIHTCILQGGLDTSFASFTSSEQASPHISRGLAGITSSFLIQLPFFLLPALIHTPMYATCMIIGLVLHKLNMPEQIANAKIQCGFFMSNLFIYLILGYVLWELCERSIAGVVLACTAPLLLGFYHGRVIDDMLMRWRNVYAIWRVAIRLWTAKARGRKKLSTTWRLLDSRKKAMEELAILLLTIEEGGRVANGRGCRSVMQEEAATPHQSSPDKVDWYRTLGAQLETRKADSLTPM